MHLLLALVVRFGWPWPVCSRVVFFLGLQGSSLFLLLFLGFGVVVASSLVCSGGLGACGVTCSFLASPLPSPLGCPLVLFGPVSLAGPSLRISGCICDGPVVIPLAWRVVAIGSCLPSASWQQRLRPCVGLCPLHHAVGVVHVPLAAALRYLPSGDPESPLNTAKAVRAYLGLCCLLLPASAAFPGVRSFLFAGLRLPASPRALAVFGLACLPRCPLSWLVFLAPPSFVVLVWLVGVAWFFAWVGWSGFPVWWWFRAVFCLFLRLACVGFARR